MIRLPQVLRTPLKFHFFALAFFALLASVGSVAAQSQILFQSPPDRTKITFSKANADHKILVSGQPGAVPGAYVVLIQNLGTRTTARTNSAADGSFAAEMAAPDGSTLLINYNNANFQHWHAGSPALVIPVNQANPSNLTSIPVTTAGPSETAGGYWMAEGVQNGLTFQPGDTLEYRLRFTVYSAGVTANLDMAQVRLGPTMRLARLSDASGREVQASLVPTVMTPTGLPIFNKDFQRLDFERGAMAFQAAVETPVRETGKLTVNAVFRGTIPSADRLPAGHYVGKIDLNVFGVPATSFRGDFAELRPGMGGFSFTPVIQIGKAEPPRIPWLLLANNLSNGSRGAVAREDRESFHFGTEVAFNAENFILPRGMYRLEPFLPTISSVVGESATPPHPLVTFALPSGELDVSVTRPDGTVEILGKKAFQTGRAGLHREHPHVFGNTSMNAVYELTTLDPSFNYQFNDYGHYVVKMVGWVEDVNGKRYPGGGTYDIYIAELLDLDLGTFLGTPFEVGDVMSPVVHVRPGVPADVRISFKLFPGSDPARAVTRRIGGRANRFGFFHPGKGAEPLTVSAAGEYVVDVTASYLDQNGVLWMGSFKGASVVETPNTSVIAHGRRGFTNIPGVTLPETMPVWFKFRDINPPGQSGEENNSDIRVQYPYHTGDVLWAADRTQAKIFPILTLQDPNNVTKLSQFASQTERILGELPVNFPPVGSSRLYALQYPEFIKTWAYYYTSVQRPGVTVRSLIGSGETNRPYWQFDDPYNSALGNGAQGDLPDDIKLQYGGVVYRDTETSVNQYAIYGSMVAMIARGTQLGQRVFPPFEGASGGPSGGTLLTVNGRDIDIFVTPVGVMPGSVLETGDVFAFSGAVWPTLPSLVEVRITTPSGTTISSGGRANKIGYFYRPADDFVITEAGMYSVNVRVTHRVGDATSAGPMQISVTGGILGTLDGTYTFYVVPRDSASTFTLDTPRTGTTLTFNPLTIKVQPPVGLNNVSAHYTTNLTGTVLETGFLSASGGVFNYTYDANKLNRTFPNLDVQPPADQFERDVVLTPADTVVVTLFLSGKDSSGQSVSYARQVLFQGKDVFALMEPPLRNIYFAQFGNGQGISSRVIAVNGSRQNTATGTAIVYDSQGKALTADINGVVQNGSFPFNIRPLGVSLNATGGTGDLKIGSVLLASTSPIGGAILFSGGLGVAGVEAAQPSVRFLVPIESNTNSGVQTGVAISNPSPAQTAITFALRDVNGVPVPGASASALLAGNGQLAQFVDEIFTGKGLNLSNFRGTLEVTSQAAINGTAIRTSPGQLATLPVTSSGSTRLLFAQLGEASGVSSVLTFVNTSPDKTANAIMRLFDDDGAPLTINLNGVDRPGEFGFSIAPRGSATFASPGTSVTAKTGSVVVESTENIGGTILFGGSFGLEGVGASRPLSNFVAPVEGGVQGGVTTGLALMNAGSAQITVKLTLRDELGRTITGGIVDVVLRPQGHVAKFLSQFYPSLDLQNFNGTISGETTGQIGATVIRQSTAPLEFATLPVTEMTP